MEYSSTAPPHSNTVTVSGSSTRRLVVGGLLPRTNYTFSVRAQGAVTARSESRFTATPTGLCNAVIYMYMYNAYNIVRAGVGLFFNGRLLSNNSIVLLDDIGEGSSALYCLTDRELCCSAAAGRQRGLWLWPRGSAISETNSDVYTSRGFSSIHLNRRSRERIPAGVYRCLLPDAGNVLRTISVTVVNNSKYN